MKISKWRFLIIFWLLAIAFLVGEFKFLRWRKEKLYSEEKMNSMMYDLNGSYFKKDICEMDVGSGGEVIDSIRLNIFCKNGKIGTMAFSSLTIEKGLFENFIKEAARLTGDSKILALDNWVCRNKEGKDYKIGMEIGKTTLIYCYEI